jgi:hypothetical protein
VRYGTKYQTWGDYNRKRAANKERQKANRAQIERDYIVDKYGRIIGPRKNEEAK